MNNWVVLKTKHSKTKTEARSTQISKTKHPNLENGAPKTRKRSTQTSKTKHPNLKNEAPKTWKWSTQDSKTKHAPKPRKWSTQILKPLYVEGLQLLSLAWRRPNQVEATNQAAPSKVYQSIPQSIDFSREEVGRHRHFIEPFFPATLLST